jgi:hypothetical protein
VRNLFRLLCACALGLMPVVGCGDEPAPEPCESASDCDDQNVCTVNQCHYKTKTCTYQPIDCRDTECKSFAFDACDPEAPDREVCGAVTIHEGRSCGDGWCLYIDPDTCQFPPFCTWHHGSYKCSSYGTCNCQ